MVTLSHFDYSSYKILSRFPDLVLCSSKRASPAARPGVVPGPSARQRPRDFLGRGLSLLASLCYKDVFSHVYRKGTMHKTQAGHCTSHKPTVPAPSWSTQSRPSTWIFLMKFTLAERGNCFLPWSKTGLVHLPKAAFNLLLFRRYVGSWGIEPRHCRLLGIVISSRTMDMGL